MPSAFSVGRPRRFSYLERVRYLAGCALVVLAALAPLAVSGQATDERLIVFGDIVYFYPPGHAAQLSSEQPVQARRAGRVPDERAQSGDRQARSRDRARRPPDLRRQDRRRADARSPERKAAGTRVLGWQSGSCPTMRRSESCGITVTAKDPQGRTGEFKPFEVQASQLTIVP